MYTFNISARRVAPLSPMLLPVRFSFLMAASPAVHLTAVVIHTRQHTSSRSTPFSHSIC